MSGLHEAINRGDQVQIKWLLDHKASVNRRDAQGNTPLMLAVRNGVALIYELGVPLIYELVARGAEIHARDRFGRTPLMLALDFNNSHHIPTLLAQYALVDETPVVDAEYDQGRLALLFAIYNEDLAAVQSLLEAGADPNARNESGEMLLMMATRASRSEIVDRLLQSGADPNTADSSGWTPLMFAAGWGNAGIVDSLLRSGADIHARVNGGNCWTALHCAVLGAHSLESARMLLERGADVNARDELQCTPLYWAAFQSNEGAVRLLLEQGADIHSEDSKGTSALVMAGWLGDAGTINALLEWGAAAHPEHLRQAFNATFTDFNQDKIPLFIETGLQIGLPEAVLLQDRAQIDRLLAEGVDQNTINRALVIAAGHAEPEIVRLFLEQGADPNATSKGWHALMAAYRNESHAVENIELLLQAGANVKAHNAERETPLFKQYDLQQMLKRGADVNAQSETGGTPLMEAAREGRTDRCRLLLKFGADVDVRDQDGRTALMLAAQNGHTRIVRLLLKYGANPAGRATDDTTALSLAKRWPGKKIATILMEAGARE